MFYYPNDILYHPWRKTPCKDVLEKLKQLLFPKLKSTELLCTRVLTVTDFWKGLGDIKTLVREM